MQGSLAMSERKRHEIAMARTRASEEYHSLDDHDRERAFQVWYVTAGECMKQIADIEEYCTAHIQQGWGDDEVPKEVLDIINECGDWEK